MSDVKLAPADISVRSEQEPQVSLSPPSASGPADGACMRSLFSFNAADVRQLQESGIDMYGSNVGFLFPKEASSYLVEEDAGIIDLSGPDSPAPASFPRQQSAADHHQVMALDAHIVDLQHINTELKCRLHEVSQQLARQ